MLSSTQLKKIRSFIAFTLFASVFLHIEASALTKLVFVDDKRNEIEMHVDHKGDTHILNSPVAGDFYYKKSSKEFIFRLEGMEQFYRLPISKVSVQGNRFSKVEVKDRRITDSQIWDILYRDSNCGVVKASTSMVKDVLLDIGDIASINNAFGYVLGADTSSQPCLNLGVSSAVSSQIGFPIYLSTNHGTTMLKEERFLEYGRRVILPKGSVLITDELMQDVYLHQMPEAARDLYLTVANGRSSNSRLKLKAIRKSLEMVKSGEWKPKEDLNKKSFQEEMKEFSESLVKPVAEEPKPTTPVYGGFDGLSE